MFCRICLNEVSKLSTNTYLRCSDIRPLIVNIFPGLNLSLTNSLQLCEECFNNINFAIRVKEAMLEKEKEFWKSNYGNLCIRPYCSLCYRFKTPDTLFFNKDNFSSHVLIEMIQIALPNFRTLDIDANICGCCWSWVRKIYFFKKKCFNLEYSLNFYCTKNNISLLADSNLEDFLHEQFYLRSEISFPSTGIDTNRSKVGSKSVAVYGENFKVNGETYSNVFNSRLMESETENYNHFIKDYFINEEKLDIEDTILISQEYYRTTIANEVCSISGPDDDSNDKSEVEIDEDDTFDEFVGNKEENNKNVVIISDDEESVSTGNLIESNKSHDIDSVFTESAGLLNSHNEKAEIIDIDENSLEPSGINSIQEEADETTLPLETISDIEVTEIDNNNTVKAINNPEIIYCGTSEYSRIYKEFTNTLSDLNDETRIENNHYHFNLSLRNKGINESAHYTTSNSTNFDSNAPRTSNVYNEIGQENNEVILNRPFDIFEINFEEEDNNKAAGNNKEEDNNTENRLASNDNLLQLDDDCFEVMEEANNIIDITNVDSYIKETQIMKRRNKWILKNNLIWGCYICIAKFEIRTAAIKHMLAHEDPWNKYGRFQCRKCSFKANWKGTVTRHEALHTKSYFHKYFGKRINYFCPYCMNIYNLKGEIQAHINEHVISWKKFQCGHCMFTTNRSEPLRQHYVKYHSKAKDPSFNKVINWEEHYKSFGTGKN